MAEVALHQDIVEADDEADQPEHLDHLDRGRRFQAGRGAQVPGGIKNMCQIRSFFSIEKKICMR